VMNTAAVVGFGGVMRTLPGFKVLVDGMKNMRMHPLYFVMFATAIVAGAAGSASGGLAISYGALAETYKSLGVPLEYIHRVSTMASGTLDSMPHNGAVISLLTLTGMTHKEAYQEIFVTTLLIPLIATGLILIPLCILGL